MARKNICDGEYIGWEFSDDYTGYKFSGMFMGCDFRGANLSSATLMGTFIDCDFRNITIDEYTEIVGYFVACIWE